MTTAGDFHSTYRCYSAELMPSRTERFELLYGGKIVMPQSALAELSEMDLEWPLVFKLTKNASEGDQISTHSGVLEFTAEEGRIYLPGWMMRTLMAEDGDVIDVDDVALPLGTFVKLQPQNVNFLDINDPKATLEKAFRNFSTLTVGDILSFMHGDKVYDIHVLETRPEGGISIIETDLEVDFAPPVGYVEPRPPEQGSIDRIEKYIQQENGSRLTAFTPFVGSGTTLNGTKPDHLERPEQVSKVPAALHLPPGRLFFGYPVIPLKKRETD